MELLIPFSERGLMGNLGWSAVTVTKISVVIDPVAELLLQQGAVF